MSMLEIHQVALSTGATAYHEFLLCYSPHERKIYAFIEGRDDTNFYRNFIESHLPENWSACFVRAGSRDKVLSAYDHFDWGRFPNRAICFFVDRDLGDFGIDRIPSASNIYVTSQYSIENVAVSEYIFLRVLDEIYGVCNITHTDEERLCEVFCKNLAQFCKLIAPLMAQIIVWRRNGARPNLKDISLRDAFEFKNGKLFRSRLYKTKDAMTREFCKQANAKRSRASELKSAEREFSAINCSHSHIRGKFLMWFFAAILNHTFSISSNVCASLKKRPKEKVSVGYANIVSIVGPRTRIPADLAAFLQENYGRHIDHLTSAHRAFA